MKARQMSSSVSTTLASNREVGLPSTASISSSDERVSRIGGCCGLYVIACSVACCRTSADDAAMLGTDLKRKQYQVSGKTREPYRARFRADRRFAIRSRATE